MSSIFQLFLDISQLASTPLSEGDQNLQLHSNRHRRDVCLSQRSLKHVFRAQELRLVPNLIWGPVVFTERSEIWSPNSIIHNIFPQAADCFPWNYKIEDWLCCMWHQPDLEATLHWLRLDLNIEKALSWKCNGSAQLCTPSCETDRGLALIPFAASQTRNLFARPLKCQSWQTTAKDFAEHAGIIIIHLNIPLYSFTAGLHVLILAPEFSLILSNGNLTLFDRLSVVFHSCILAMGYPWQFEAAYSSLPSHLTAACRKRMRTLCMLPFFKAHRILIWDMKWRCLDSGKDWPKKTQQKERSRKIFFLF